MPEADGAPEIGGVCDADNSETWCEAKQRCVQDWVGGQNGPCEETPEVVTKRVHALNGFIARDANVE